jgi:hypothetical protein
MPAAKALTGAVEAVAMPVKTITLNSLPVSLFMMNISPLSLKIKASKPKA